jgi:hypothetical protein
MQLLPLVLAYVSCLSFHVTATDFKGFDDQILFSLNWPGDTLLVSSENRLQHCNQ